jgi:hypothetical protein
MASEQSQSSELSDLLSSSQLCYLELLQQEIPEEILDLDYFWHPETGADQSGGMTSDDISDSQLVRYAEEIEAMELPEHVLEELQRPFEAGKHIV